MQKLLEIKGPDFLKGQSFYIDLPVGGLFRSVSNWNPFEQGGVALPAQNPVTVNLGTIPKQLTSFNASGTDYIYVHTATKLYQVLKDSPYTVTDVTSQINQGIVPAVDRFYGACKWKSGYVYAVGTAPGAGNAYEIHYNTFPVNSANDVVLKTLIVNDIAQDYIPFCQGADGNLYYGNQNRIQEITNAAGTSGNSVFYFIDDGFIIRDIVNDGRYLVIIADNNAPTGNKRIGGYKCKVYFWDMVQTDANSRIIPVAMWDINDPYMIAAAVLEDGIYLFGYNGLYICNSITQPRMIRTFFNASVATDSIVRPLNPYQVSVHSGSIHWVDGVNTISTSGYYNPDVYAYGNPITGEQKILYRPFTTGVNQLPTCLLWLGDNLVVGVDTPALYFFNTGAARGTLTIQSLNISMLQPFEYAHTKVVLTSSLSSGQSVTCSVYRKATNEVLSTETKSYNSGSPKQTLLFRKNPVGAAPHAFEDIELIVRSTGAAIRRITVYGTMLEDGSEEF